MTLITAIIKRACIKLIFKLILSKP